MSISSVTSKIIRPIYEKAGCLGNKFAEKKFISNMLEEAYKDPSRSVGKLFLISIISKDFVNCVLYTYQSWNNERIPKDKRKFVAFGDLIQGFVNVGGQALAGILVDRKLVPWVNSFFTGTTKDKNGKEITINSNRIFHPDNIRAKAAEVLNEEPLQKILKEKNINVADVNLNKVAREVSKNKALPFVSGLTLVVTTLLTNALIKRTLNPMISTPIAGFVNDTFVKSKNDPKTDTRKNYEWQSVVAATSKYHNKEDKVAFSRMSSVEG